MTKIFAVVMVVAGQFAFGQGVAASKSPASEEAPPAQPIFLKDNPFNYSFSGIWEMRSEKEGGWQGLISIDAGKGSVNLIFQNLSHAFPGMGSTMYFNGAYKDGRITGKTSMLAADGVNYVHSPADIKVIDADNLEISTGYALKRRSKPLGANVLCDPVRHRNLRSINTHAYADQDEEQSDFGNAACWYYLSALQGDARAQGMIGVYLLQGKGVKLDAGQGFYWTKKGADQGDWGAEQNLAVAYKMGAGTPPDLEKSAFYQQKANEQGRNIAFQQRAQLLRSALGLFFDVFGSMQEYENQISDYEHKGMSRDDAEHAVQRDAAESGFFEELNHPQSH